MKTIIIATGLVIVMGVLVHYFDNSGEVILNEKPQISATSTEVVVEEDVIEKANRELERINQELDDEESRLLEKQELLDLEYASSSDIIQSRLEEIRETRTSF